MMIHTTFEKVYEEIILLNCSKASPKDTIPANIIKNNCDIFAQKLHFDFNCSINSCTFPNNLKLADISPAFPQINSYIDSKLSKYQCGFRKGFSAQHCLLVMLEKWRATLDNRGFAGVLLTDLSKAFDCLSHDLLTAKLDAYGFDYNSVKLIHDYLNNRFRRVRINSHYSSWKEIIYGVPQGSILGPLLFNIYLSDLFMFTKESDIANYADDNSPYACKKDIDSVISQLEADSKTLLE